MKKIRIILLLMTFCFPVIILAQTGKVKKELLGKWIFEAPYAPEGYTLGTIEVSFGEKKYSATMTFTGNENKIPGNKVKFENDTLAFSVVIENQDVAVTLRFEEKSRMSGKAVYSEGEVPLTLTREKKKK